MVAVTGTGCGRFPISCLRESSRPVQHARLKIHLVQNGDILPVELTISASKLGKSQLSYCTNSQHCKMRYNRVVLYNVNIRGEAKRQSVGSNLTYHSKWRTILVKMENTVEVVELYLILLYVLLYVRVHQCTAVQTSSTIGGGGGGCNIFIPVLGGNGYRGHI